MGIQGLHKGLGFATQKTTLQNFRGKSLAIDSSSWLHRSVYSVSQQYVEGIERNHIQPQCIRASAKYIISRVHELFQCFEIGKVYLVMDGKRCPLKADTNEERERNRQANLSEARAYQKQGRRDKAEEKYKMCIKIKDELTFAVMKEVKQAFHNNPRLHLVWSPYEADAQLAKLCIDGIADAVITEDSDVLVYSAAANCAFPVIYKLERQTGSCDVISMDWLLNYQEGQDTSGTGNNKQKNALETLLINLASRQAKRPGFGVRLFVQGCVLAGCDYAPNKLSGVGLVNAFKYVRDNAFRNDTVRFQKILDSIPRKNKANIDVTTYEKILAQSEAVFYYHVVTHQDRGHRFLCEPRVSEPEAGAEHSQDHHFPLMARFEDWSFVGDTRAPEAITTKSNQRTQKKPVHKLFAPLPRKPAPAKNPYMKVETKKETGLKRPRPESRIPLSNLDLNGPTDGLESNVADVAPAKSLGKPINCNTTSDTFYSDQNRMDPRYVKRKFPRSTDKENSNFTECEKIASISPTENGASEPIPIESPRDAAILEPLALESSVDCGAPKIHIERTGEMPSAFFDLTDSNSMPVPSFDDNVVEEDSDGFILYHEAPTRVSLDGSVDFRQRETHHDDDSSDQECNHPRSKRHKESVRQNSSTQNKILVKCSPYFRGNSDEQGARLSDSDDFNEIVESPDDSNTLGVNLSLTSSRGVRVTGLKPVRLLKSYRSGPCTTSLTTGTGPIARGFQIQLERHSANRAPMNPPAQTRAWQRNVPPLPSRKRSSTHDRTKMNKMTSFFSKVEKNPSTGDYKSR